VDALGTAIWAGDLDSPGGLLAAAEAARVAPPGPEPPRPVDVLLDALALRLTEGYAPAAPLLTRALELGLTLDVADDEVDRWRWLASGRGSAIVALELWDAESAHAMAAVQAQFARDTGAPVYLQFALNSLATTHLLAGELTTAARLIEEDRLIAEVTGNPPVGYAAMALAAWQGQEAQASELIEATSRAATARGLGRMVSFADYASSVLYNGLGRHDLARDAAWRAFVRDELGYGPLAFGTHPGDAFLVGAGHRSPCPRPARRRRRRRAPLPRVDRPPEADPRSRRMGIGAFAERPGGSWRPPARPPASAPSRPGAS
jgi:hypothetical protein